MNKLLARLLLFVTILLFWVFYCSRARSEEPVSFWSEKITEAKYLLSGAGLKHSPKTAVYKELRILSPQGQSKKSKTIAIKRTDYVWKEAGLALMNMKTGKIALVKIKKEGQKLVNSDSVFLIEIESRVNGLTWNGRNTAFHVAHPPGWAVIANKWIERINGKAVGSIYVPYSTGLHQRELTRTGDSHLESDATVALNTLFALNVKSLVFPDKSVSEIVKADFPKNLVLTEQTDPQEFYAFKSGTLKYSPFERVKILLALNGREAFPSYNRAGAVGLTQFTNKWVGRKPGTWDTVRGAYPAAKLSEFKIGAVNHLESIEAAILLYDFNLDKLIRAFGRKILDDKNLDSYLYAAHNCGIDRVIKALKRTKPGQDWRIALRKLGKTDETIMFLDKIDYLVAEKK